MRDLLGLDPTGLDPEFYTGYLDLDLGGADVVGVVTFWGNQGQYRATLPMVQSGRTAASFLHVAQSNQLGYFTGLAILNAEPQATSVTVREPAGAHAASESKSKRVIHLLIVGQIIPPEAGWNN